jgi:hypothetical protein
MLFKLFVWIDIMPNVYFVIIFTSNVIHKMFLYVVKEVSPFFVGILCFWTTLFATRFFLFLFDPRGRP